jgi:hypothetical protein
MFFNDPLAAFANVRRAGGRVALAVFRAAGENPWPNGPLEAVRHMLPPIPTPGRRSQALFPGLIRHDQCNLAHTQRTVADNKAATSLLREQ